MSKGPGRIERSIRDVFAAEPDGAFTAAELCQRIYPGINRAEKKHRVAVLRALGNLLRRNPEFGALISEKLGGSIVAYSKLSVMSYGLGRLKASEHYGEADSRLPLHWFKSEMDLREDLARGKHHHLVADGGAWWGHVMSWRAEMEARRAGDDEALDTVLADRESDNARMRKIILGTVRAAL